MEDPPTNYFDRPELSQSGAKLLLRSPAKFRWEQDNPTPSTRAMDVGTAAHSMILGGPHIVTIPTELLGANGAASTKAARQWRADAEAGGLVVLSAGDYAAAVGMAKAVANHPEASRLLINGEAEVEKYFTDPETFVECRAKLDYLTDDYLVDVKTTVDASPDGFSRAVYNFGYHVQAAWYEQAAEYRGPMHIIAVEKTPPFLVAVYTLDEDALALGHETALKARELYAHCVATDTWPGYAGGVLSLPRWAR